METSVTRALFPAGPTTGCAPKMFDYIIANDLDEIKRMLEDPSVDINEGSWVVS